MSKFDPLIQAIVELDQEKSKKITTDLIEEGHSPIEILEEGIVKGIYGIGTKFEEKEYFLSELILGARISDGCIQIVTPFIPKSDLKTQKTVLLATVKGDLHSIGRNMVALMLEVSGFNVVNLGEDIPSHTIIEQAEKSNADIIGMSALLLTTMSSQAEVIQMLSEMGLREKYKVMVGGACTSQEWSDSIGADGWSADAMGAVRVAKTLCEGGNK